MATEPKRGPIKRVAVLVEFEDGNTFAVYAQPGPLNNDAVVTLKMDRPELGRAFLPICRSIHVDGLHEYRVATDMPAMIGAVLDSVRTAVDL